MATYNSVTEVLENKYGKQNVDQMDFPDFRNKTVFLDKKGNDISDSVLTYAQADSIIDDAINTEIP